MLIRLTPSKVFLIRALLAGDELTFLLEPHLEPELLRKAQNGAPRLILVTGRVQGRIAQNSQKSFPGSPGLGVLKLFVPPIHSPLCSSGPFFSLQYPVAPKLFSKAQVPASSSMHFFFYAWFFDGFAER